MPVIEEVVCRRDFTMHAKGTLDTIRFSNGLHILCVSLGLGQFLDRIAVQEQDRKFEPFFGFSPTAGSAVHACCERTLCSILRVGAVRDAPQNEPCSPKTKSSKHTHACVCPPPASCEYIANKYQAHACVLRQICTDAPSYGAWRWRRV